MRWPARFPWRFGGADKTVDQEHQALLDALSPGWDVSDDTELYAETGTDAMGVTIVWQISRRFGNAFIPTKMIDLLESYERACHLRPKKTDPRRKRRNAVAARLRGLAGHTVADIAAAARNAAGSSFVDLVAPSAADIFSYWPGINPGPPGFEFMSNRAQVAIHLNGGNIDDADYRLLVTAVERAVDAVKPAWLRVVIGTGSGDSTTFVAGTGVTGMTVI
jgi:uncharacterized protein YmfQ (DUF2313 family)